MKNADNHNNHNELEKKGRVVAFLTREEIDFIDKLAKDALFSTGHKLTRTDIISALVDLIMNRGLNGEGVHSKTELEERLLGLMKATFPQTVNELKKAKKKGATDASL